MSITVIKTALSVSILAATGIAIATASPTLGTIKPLQGLAFDVGTNRAVGYFVQHDGDCKLVLTIAGSANWGDEVSHTATRFETTIAAGRSANYDPKEGQVLEFACQDDAAAMSISEVERFAQTGGR